MGWREGGELCRFSAVDTLPSKAPGLEPARSGLADKQGLLARLLGRLAHEIRNPLSSLDIHVQLLDEDLTQTAPQTRQRLAGRLEIIHGELKRLENIVRRFLRLASPSALELERVELPVIVGHICKLLGPEAEARQIEFVTHVDPAVPVLRADGVQLTQALLNLVINALQAVKERGRIEVRAGRHAQNNAETVFIEVQDSGPGVPEEELGAVFDPYFTTKEEGSGLGLWIAQQIAVAHGGTLEVSNALQGGAVFRLSLPLREENRADG
jgi:signal transduction histidine kinase